MPQLRHAIRLFMPQLVGATYARLERHLTGLFMPQLIYIENKKKHTFNTDSCEIEDFVEPLIFASCARYFHCARYGVST